MWISFFLGLVPLIALRLWTLRNKYYQKVGAIVAIVYLSLQAIGLIFGPMPYLLFLSILTIFYIVKSSLDQSEPQNREI